MIDNIIQTLGCDDAIVIAIYDDEPEETKLVSSLDSEEDNQAVLFYLLSKNLPDTEEVSGDDVLAELTEGATPEELEALNQFLKQAEQLRKDLGLR